MTAQLERLEGASAGALCSSKKAQLGLTVYNAWRSCLVHQCLKGATADQQLS